MNGGNRIDTAPIASSKTKEKAGLRTRIASRLSLVNGGDRIDTAQPQEEKAKINDLFYGGYFRVSDL